MATPDLNLLLTLDVLLAEGSVARAARRLQLSPSAMSRALARLRRATADPLLVRAGRVLVPSPRAVELRERVGRLVQEAQAVLGPARDLDPGRLARTFTLRTGDGFVESYGAALVARVHAEAPAVRLRFVPKPDGDGAPLRDGAADLETGVVGRGTHPELRVQAIFQDGFVGVVRRGHPLSRGRMTVSRLTRGRHVAISRRGREKGPVDDALAALGQERRIAAVVVGFSAALALARGSDLIAAVPERQTSSLRAGMHTFRLPVRTPEVTVSLLWHPRLDADAGHRWLRDVVRDVCSHDLGQAGRRAIQRRPHITTCGAPPVSPAPRPR